MMTGEAFTGLQNSTDLRRGAQMYALADLRAASDQCM